MTLLGAICVVLIADLFVDDEKRVITFWIALASLAVHAVGAGCNGAGRPDRHFRRELCVSDPLSQVLKIAAVGFVAVVFHLFPRLPGVPTGCTRASSTCWGCSACSAC